MLTKFFQPLTLKTKIAQIKKIKRGEHVGYGDAFIAPNEMTIAIVPIGYFDGLDRRLSNKGVMKIGNVFCPIVGIVAMNVSIIDITRVKGGHVGQEVIVYSSDQADKNSLDAVARMCGTIPQDLLVHLPETMPRKVVS